MDVSLEWRSLQTRGVINIVRTPLKTDLNLGELIGDKTNKIAKRLAKNANIHVDIRGGSVEI